VRFPNCRGTYKNWFEKMDRIHCYFEKDPIGLATELNRIDSRSIVSIRSCDGHFFLAPARAQLSRPVRCLRDWLARDSQVQAVTGHSGRKIVLFGRSYPVRGLGEHSHHNVCKSDEATHASRSVDAITAFLGDGRNGVGSDAQGHLCTVVIRDAPRFTLLLATISSFRTSFPGQIKLD